MRSHASPALSFGACAAAGETIGRAIRTAKSVTRFIGFERRVNAYLCFMYRYRKPRPPWPGLTRLLAVAITVMISPEMSEGCVVSATEALAVVAVCLLWHGRMAVSPCPFDVRLVVMLQVDRK